AVVGQMDFRASVGVARQSSKINLRRLGLELRALQDVGRQFGKKLIEPAVGVGKSRRLQGGHGQVSAAQATQKRSQESLFEHVQGGLPVVLAGQGKLVEVLADLAAREYELIGKRRGAGVDRPAALSGKHGAVVIAIRSVGGIDARTLPTD